MELKNIFKRADSNSLILGDEISHGTETLSALSIVASAVIKLSKMGTNFIFATHLHQLISLEEITSLKNVVAKHLEVYFDEKIQTNKNEAKLREFKYQNLYLKKGEELGRFEMGSTILLFFGEEHFKYLNQKDDIEVGEILGEIY